VSTATRRVTRSTSDRRVRRTGTPVETGDIDDRAVILAQSLIKRGLLNWKMKKGKKTPGFLVLIEMLRENKPGTEVAAAFKVSKQRASQWRKILGQEEKRTEFHVRPCVDRILKATSERQP
jgi:hypothetical protein